MSQPDTHDVRTGAPSTRAPVRQTLLPGAKLVVVAEAQGDTVAGNALWYQEQGGAWFWSGGVRPAGA